MPAVTEKNANTVETPARHLEFAAVPWIEANIGKEKGEQLEIKHLWGDNYRVNWRKPTQSGFMVFLPIVRSAFVTCTKGENGKGLIQIK